MGTFDVTGLRIDNSTAGPQWISGTTSDSVTVDFGNQSTGNFRSFDTYEVHQPLDGPPQVTIKATMPYTPAVEPRAGDLAWLDDRVGEVRGLSRLAA